MSKRTKPSDESGSDGAISAADGSSTQTSKPSLPPKKDSSRRWRRPNNAKEFAAQVNDVATLLLNGEIDFETARTFGTLGRTVAQIFSTEVQRARFLKCEADTTLPPAMFDQKET